MRRAAVRVALQSGATAVASVLWSAIGLIFVAAFGAAAVGGILSGQGVAAVMLVPAGIGLLVLGYFLKRARSRRASDLVVDATGLRIEGGSMNGGSFPWSDLAGARIEVNEKEYVKTSTPFGETIEYLNLLIFTDRANVDTTVAEAMDPAEKASLADIARAVQAAHAAGTGNPAPPAKPTLPSVVYCTSCGAPVAPADAPIVVCHQCGAAVPMRPDLRQSIASAVREAADRSHVDALVGKLLDQPGAGTTNLRIAAFAGLYLLFPVTLVANQAGILLFGGIVAVGWGLVSWAIGDRLAVRALVLGFAARAPVAEGHPYGCRRCGGPLPPAAEAKIVVACAYCRAENVIGLDAFAHDRTPDEDADLELGEALTGRTKARLWAIAKIAVGAALVVSAVAVLARVGLR